MYKHVVTPLRNPIYILSLLLILFVYSCGQNSSEENVNGKWFDVDNEYSSWDFYQDSLVFPEDKVKWKATKSIIEFDYPTFYWDSAGKPVHIIDKIRINYQLSADNDSLFGTLKNRYGKHKFSLLKAENYIEYLNKKFEIEFSIPKNNTAELIDTDAVYGLKVFIGILNDSIIAKTELSDNLDHLETDIEKFKDSIKPSSRDEIDTHEMLLHRRFHLRVFADRSIPDSMITKQLKATIFLKNSEVDKHYPENLRGRKRDTLPIRIYRIFENKEDINPWKIKGKEIKTIANNVYN